MNTVKVKKLKEEAVIPTRATEGSAGADLYACINEPITIEPGKLVKIPTGIAIELDSSEYAAMIFARSGSWLLYLSAVCRPRISSGLRDMTSVRL